MAQRRDEDSLLGWFERMIHSLRECPEVGSGHCEILDHPLPRCVFGHRAESEAGRTLFLHNLSADPVTVSLGPQPGGDDVLEMFADQHYDPVTPELDRIDLDRYDEPDSTERAAFRRALGIRPETFVVLYAGRLDAEKGIEVLIDAIQGLSKRKR